VFELALIQELVNKGRRFWKPLRYDAKNDKVFANVLLLDMGPSPVPLYGSSPFMTPQQRDRVRKAISKAGDHVEVWDLSRLQATEI
jgi:Protein of unknown function (DUF1173)